MSVKAEARPLTGPRPGGAKPGATVSVEPLLAGTIRMPAAALESAQTAAKLQATGLLTPRSRWLTLPVPAFLIDHPRAGTVLVDTGLHPSVAAKPAANLGRIAATFLGPELPDGDLASQLRSMGRDPKSIRTVLITHLHVDHASGISEFPNATFILAQEEWEAAISEPRPLLKGYRPAHYDYLFDYRTIDFNGPLISSYASFGRTFDLFGDGSVRIASTPGHSPGHCSVIARLERRDFVIAGDAIYTRSQLAGGPPPPLPDDEHRWRRSARELIRMAEDYPQAVIVPGHDTEYFNQLDERYE